MPGDEHGPFNLFQAVLLFVERASRGGKVAVPRDEFVRGLKRFFPGITYNQLRGALRQLNNQGVIYLEMLGPDDFNARLTESGQELLAKNAALQAIVSPKPFSPAVGQPQARSPTAPTPLPPAAPAVRRAEAPAPRPHFNPVPQVQKEPEPVPPAPEEEKVELSTFADVAPTASSHDADLGANGKRNMEDWLNQRLSALNDREETVMAKETKVFEREESLRSSEAAFIAKADEIEKEVAADLERIMEELVRQEHLLTDRIASNPSRDSGLTELLHKIKECEIKLEELDKERGLLRKMIRDVTGGHARGTRERER